MRSVALLLVIAACDRPPELRPAPRGVELEQVQLTTWRGAEVTAKGTASRATLTVDGFVADDVTLTTATGTTLRAPKIDGQMDLKQMAAAQGLAVKSQDGCTGSTAQRVDYVDGIATTTGPVQGGGCGFTLHGSRLVYSLPERRAEVFGPVRTRIEASP